MSFRNSVYILCSLVMTILCTSVLVSCATAEPTPIPVSTAQPTEVPSPTVTPGGPTFTPKPKPTITPGGPTRTPKPTITPGGPTKTPRPTATLVNTVTPAAPQAAGCQPVAATSVVGMTVSGNTLQKAAGVEAGWNAEASSSQQILSGDGSLQVTVDVTTTHKMIGLSHQQSVVGYSDIDYALYMHASDILYVYEVGKRKGAFGTYSPADILKVAIEGGTVKYYRNSTLFYTSTVAPKYPLFMDASINTPGAQLQNVTICFGQKR